MKVLKGLTAGKATAAKSGPVTGSAWVCDEPVKGVLRRVVLTAGGVVVERPVASGERLQVMIPIAEVLRLAEEAEPAMKATAADRKANKE